MVASLKRWPSYAVRETQRVDRVYSEVGLIESISVRFLLGEILLIRTAQILEEILPEIFCRLACGSKFVDGTAPLIHKRSTSLNAAFGDMRLYGRPKPLPYLKWLGARNIRRNMENLLDANDDSLRTTDRYLDQLDEIRAVRNHAAHRVKGTKPEYQKVILRYYGSSTLTVPVGKFVLSDRRVKPAPLLQYTATVRALVRELCKS